MASSIYSSLQGESRQFRLLVLEPSTDRLAPVRCKLNLASFDDDDLKYTALSYFWGDPQETTPILLNGIETQITLNLEAALRHIRQAPRAVVLWVDALCIDQKNEAEKVHQVEMMGEIYSGAELVIAWLGSAGEDSDLAMEVLGKGSKASMAGRATQHKWSRGEGLGLEYSSTVNNTQRDDTHAQGYEGDLAIPPAQNPVSTPSSLQPSSPESQTDLRAASSFSAGDEDSTFIRFSVQKPTTREALAIYRLLTRSWWSRIWVIQEVFLAKMLLFKCGDAEVSKDKLSSWRTGELLMTMVILGNDDVLNDQVLPAMSLLENLCHPMVGTYTALDYLAFYGRREATRPHDHIYALFGLMPAKDRQLIGTPDYGCRVEDLFIRVVAKLMVEHNSLWALRAAGTPSPMAATTSKKMDLPSWVPDWTTTWLPKSRHRMEEADGSLSSFSGPSFHFSEDAKELEFRGFEFDMIESVKSVPTYGQGKMPIWKDGIATKECVTEKPLHMLIVALFIPWLCLERLDNERGFVCVAVFFRELEEYQIFLHGRETTDGHVNCDYLAGFLEWMGETRDDRTEEEILEKIFNAEAARSFVKWYHSVELQPFYSLFTILRQGLLGTAGFSMFRTYKGYFGIMQAAAVAGDILCVVPSCHTMLVLRKTQSSKYLLIGPSCPIAGALHGEVAQAVERGEITKESFTLV